MGRSRKPLSPQGFPGFESQPRRPSNGWPALPVSRSCLPNGPPAPLGRAAHPEWRSRVETTLRRPLVVVPGMAGCSPGADGPGTLSAPETTLGPRPHRCLAHDHPETGERSTRACGWCVHPRYPDRVGPGPLGPQVRRGEEAVRREGVAARLLRDRGHLARGEGVAGRPLGDGWDLARREGVTGRAVVQGRPRIEPVPGVGGRLQGELAGLRVAAVRPRVAGPAVSPGSSSSPSSSNGRCVSRKENCIVEPRPPRSGSSAGTRRGEGGTGAVLNGSCPGMAWSWVVGSPSSGAVGMASSIGDRPAPRSPSATGAWSKATLAPSLAALASAAGMPRSAVTARVEPIRMPTPAYRRRARSAASRAARDGRTSSKLPGPTVIS